MSDFLYSIAEEYDGVEGNFRKIGFALWLFIGLPILFLLDCVVCVANIISKATTFIMKSLSKFVWKLLHTERGEVFIET